MPWLSGQRCILPVAGYYAWQRTPSNYRQPYFVRLINREVFGFAAVWDRSVGEDDDVIESCSVVRVPANDLLADIANSDSRMPAILRRRDYDTWLRGTPVQAKAALQQAQNPESDKSEPVRILAPVDGYVLNVYEESARVVTTSMPIMEVGDPKDLEAEIELLSSDAVGVAPGADVFIEDWGGESPLRGRVSVVEPGAFTKISALGVEEQRVKVRVDFLDPTPPGRELGDRYRVEARIVTWHGDNVLQVPIGALFRRGNDWMTFAVKEGKARLLKAEIAHNNGIAAEVRSGLVQGDAVIIHPADTVHDGASVSADH